MKRRCFKYARDTNSEFQETPYAHFFAKKCVYLLILIHVIELTSTYNDLEEVKENSECVTWFF